MKKSKSKVRVDQLIQHPYHQLVNKTTTDDYLKESLIRTGNEPVYPIIVVPVNNPEIPDLYFVTSGMNRLNTLKQMGKTEVEVIVYDITDETQVKNMIIDLNKQRIKSGREIMMEFRHYCEMYPEQRGIPGNRYSKIGKEMGRSKDMIKDFVMLDKFFHGQGDVVMEKIFGGELSVSQGFLLKKVVEKYPEKFTSEESFSKLCDRSFDFKRLDYSLSHLDLNNELEFDIIKSYLMKERTLQEFQKKLEQLGKVERRVLNHNNSKVEIPEIDEDYVSKHAQLFNCDNRFFEPLRPFSRLIMSMVGSCPYGNLRLNSDDPNSETGHNMSGREYGVYLAETYAKYLEHMDPRGSIYVIIDDYRNEDGSLALSLEHFVVEMEHRGFYLVGRYVWSKINPQPRSYNVKNMVGGFEMVYRFSTNPELCYFNPDLFIELDESEKRITHGCTNTDNKGKTTRGNSYVQSHLKKVRNTLDEQTCMDVIRGNVAHPEDYFRLAEEKRHTSTSPIYLTSVLILESTKPGDLVVDIWGGVGNTMESALLLGRDFVGIEKEENYHKQAQRRLQIIENGNQDSTDFIEQPTIQIAA